MTRALRVVGIELATRVCHLVGTDQTGKIVCRKSLSRSARMPWMVPCPPVRVAMEACGGAHEWARRVREHGHEVTWRAPPGCQTRC